MIVSNVSEEELETALRTVSEKYDGNITWNRFPEALNKAGTRFRLTLRCKSSREKGHGVSHSTGHPRRLVSACWHVHGDFFDALPAYALIRVGSGLIHPGDAWQDFNVGSLRFPYYASESCDCKAALDVII